MDSGGRYLPDEVTAPDAYRLIGELTSDFAYSLGVGDDGRIELEWLTDGFTKVTGFSAEDLQERGGWRGLIHPDSTDTVAAGLQTLLSGASHEAEVELVTRSGSSRWVRAVSQAVRDDDDRVICIFGVARDITEEKRAKDLAARYQARLIASFEEAAIGIAILLPNGELTEVNEELARMLGRSREDLLGKELCDYAIAQDRDLVNGLGPRLIADPTEKEHNQVRFRRGDGGQVVARLTASLVRRSSGDPNYVVAQLTDITESHALFELLEERERMLAAAERIGHLGSVNWDIKSDVVTWSDELYRIYGVERDDFVPSYAAWMELIHPDDRDLVRDSIHDALTKGASYDVYFRINAKDGGTRVMEARGEVQQDETGEPVRLLAISRDVTEQMEAEGALAAEAARLRLLSAIARASNTGTTVRAAFEVALEQICLFTGWEVGHCVLVDAGETRTIASSDQWFYLGDRDISPFRSATDGIDLIIPGGLHSRVLDSRAFASIPDVNAAEVFLRAEAARASGLHSAHAFPVLSGQDVVAVLEFFTFEPSEVDAELEALMNTVGVQLGRALERERAATELAQRQSQLEEAQFMASMGSWEWERAGGSFLYSKALLNMFGFPLDGELGFPDLEAIVHPEDRDDLLAARERVAQDGGGPVFHTFRVVLPDGSVKVIESRTQIEADAEGNIARMIVVDHDVTERKRAERLLACQAETLHMVATKKPLGQVLDHIAQCVERETQGALCSIHLVEEGILRRGAAPSLPDAFNEAVDGLATAEHFGPCGAVARLGQEVIAQDLANDPLWSAFAEVALPHRLRACWSSPIMTRDDEVVGTFALYHREAGRPSQVERDVVGVFSPLASTVIERDRAEKAAAKLEEEYRQAQKMNAVGRLAGGVAHDFNNLLQATISSAHLLREALGDNDPRRTEVDTVLDASSRGADLVRQLLSFARRDPLEPRLVDLNRCIEELMPLMRATVGESVELTIDLSPFPIGVVADPHSLEQVVLNLLRNARDATGRGGRIDIATRLDASRLPQGRRGEVALCVTDNGTGMTPEVAARAFDPFFTTKAPGQGSGLGLASVYGSVEAAGGHLHLDTSPGQGTTFSIFLPFGGDPVAQEREARGPDLKQAPRQQLGVLVAEDEEIVAKVIRKALEQAGHTVLLASDGAEALDLALSDTTRLDVVITDVVMPKISGPEVVRRLRDSGRSFAALYMTGYSEDVLDRGDLLDPGDGYIAKPFTPEELLATLQALGSGAAPLR